MRVRRALLLLSVVNVAVAVVLLAVHPHGSELGRLRSVLHFRLVRDDSSSFLEVACATARGGLPVYEELFFGQGFKFIYPPSALLTCGVADALGMRLVTLINLLALGSVALTLVLDGELFLLLCPTDKPWRVRGLVASLGVMFSPLIFAVYLGQMQALLDLLFTFAVWAWVRGNKGWAGVAVALVCVYKPPLAFFVVWALLRREWRFLGWFVGVGAVVQGVAVGRFGWRNEVDYVRVLSFLSHHGEVLIGNQSVNGFLERWVGNGVGVEWTRTSAYPSYNGLVYGGTVAAWALLLGFGLGWPVWRGWVRDSVEGRGTDFLMFGLLATVASPIAWTHHYGLFYVGCVYFAALALKQRGWMPWWFVGCFLVLANTWTVLDGLEGTRWNPVLSYDLFAGLGVIAGLGFWVGHGERDGRQGSRDSLV